MGENRLSFEANPYHNIILKERKYIEISGVKIIDHFDDEEFLLETVQGWLEITGKDLSLDKLDKERGEVIIKGKVDSITYTSTSKGNKETLFSKIFK